MFMGLGMPIPDLSNKPGPGRPGWGPTGTYDFQFRVEGTEAVVIKANAAGAGNFRISWPNGTTQVLSGNNVSITAPDATDGIVSINNEELDTTYCDEFAVIGGKSVVREVISWGANPWNNLVAAFDACANLINISTTSLITDTTGNLQAAFRDCTSLTEAICKTWNLSAGALIADLFEGCTNLTKLDFTGVKIKISSNSARAFKSVGNATTDGCEFLFSGLDLSTSTYTGNQNFGWFRYTKIKPTSTFANWSFNPSVPLVNFSYPFESATITGTNSILDISGWSSYNGYSMSQWFQNFNQFNVVGNTGAKINLTNLNTTNVNSMYFFGWQCGVTEFIGLSTLGANTGNTGTINMERAFSSMRFLKLSGSSNFGNTFTSSIKPITFKTTFNELGLSLTSDFSEAPVLSNIDASQCVTFQNMFQSCKLSTMPNLDTVTFPTAATSFSGTFSSINATSYSGSHLDLSNVTMKPSTLVSAFSTLRVQKLTLGNNVDLSECTTLNSAFINGGTNAEPLEVILPTDADYSSVTGFTTTFQGLDGPSAGNPPLTTCVADTLIRRLFATNLNGALTLNLELTKITEAPSVVQSQLEQLRTAGWNITDNSTDATLPFAYASYFVDPTGITTISPTTTPPAGSVFTATNGLSISASGVITIGSFRGGSTIRCTYPDGCYNEVVMLIQVPFKMTIEVPNGGIDLAVNYAVTSGGEYAVDWGDGVNEIVSGNKTHTWSNSTGSTITREMSFFDSPGGSVFRGFSNWIYNTYLFAITPTTSTARRLRITQWGEIKWNSAGQFQNLHDLDVLATDAPDLSETTTLAYWFSQNNKKRNPIFTNANDSLSTWNVSTITDMNSTFWNLRAYQGDLSSWDVSNVTNMAKLFASNSNYQVNAISCNVNGWDTSSVTNLNSMFFQNNGNTGVEAELGRNAILTYGYPAEHQLTSNITGATDGVYTGITATNISYSHSQQVIPTFEITVQGGTIVKARPDQYVFSNRNNASNIIQFDTSSMGGTGNGQITLYGRWRNELPGNTNTQRDLSNWKTSLVTNFSSMFYTGYAGLTNFNTKMVNGTLRWDIAAATSFSNWWYNSGGPSSSANWPSNWKLPTGISLGNFAHRGMNNADVDSFSTKTVNETWYGGTSYTAWDVSTVTSFANAFNYGNLQSVKNYNIGTWNVTSSATNIANLLMTDINGYGSQPVFDQDLGHWDVTNVTAFGANWLGNRRATLTSGNLSTANLDSIYDITNGWGQDAASVQSGVTIGFGTSQYTATNVVQGTCNNTGTNNTNCNDYGNSPFVTAGVQVGDIAYNVTTGQYSKVLSIVFTGTGITTDQAIWSNGDIYRVERSDAVKGRYALIQAGWTITDGGLYVPPITPLKFDVNITTSTTNANLEFKIPFITGTNFSIKWGDGNTDTGLSVGNSSVTHTYLSADTYSIEIGQAGDAGPPTKIAFGPPNGEVRYSSTPGNGAKAVTEITQWGSIQWADVVSMWAGCTNLDTISATDTPDLSNVGGTNGTKFMFGAMRLYDGFDAPSLSTVNSSINNWDVSGVRNFSFTFQRANSFNASINNWDISGIDQASGLVAMFKGARLFNQSLSNWTLPSAVTSLSSMFASMDTTNGFNQDIGSWDVSNILNMSSMFSSNGAYTGIGLENWERTTAGNTSTVGNVTNMSGMFYYGFGLTNTAISNWDTSKVTNFSSMFGRWGYPTVANPQIDVGNIVKYWDTSSATTFASMFTENRAINQNLGSINISSLTSGIGMFYRSNLMSSANYTDTLVGFAQFVKNQTPDAPLGVNFSNQQQVTYDTTRSASGFTPATAGRARSFLTLDVTVSGGTGVNGVYYYDYANDKWVKETDSTYVIEWNGDESSWELKYEGSVVNEGSGGTQSGGPESSTSWSGGLTVVDSSKGWSITADTITT